ncbi:hypothetical protein MT418_006024 [Batrachochytrium dendrobatidis]
MIVDIALIASLAIASVAAHASGDIVKSNALSSVKSSSHRAAVNPTMSYTLGAPLLTGSMSIYYIYYGTWSAAQKSIIEDFTNGLGQSTWWGVLKGYYSQQTTSGQKTFVSGACALGGTVSDNYTLGKSLSGTNIPDLINTYVGSGALPDDPNGVYVVLTAPDVSESVRADASNTGTFCKDYCGYHLTTTLASGSRVPYAMVGNPSVSCMNGCGPSQNANASPNGDAGVDAMLNTVAGQIASAVINPQSDGIRAWQDANGFEGSDLCSFSFGTTAKTANGGTYNLGWANRNFLIQQNWDLTSQSCISGGTGTPPPIPSSSTTTVTTTTVATTVVSTTDGSTTALPTTDGSTTAVSTTDGSTTALPTTDGSTTALPTTDGSTTALPTTDGSTTALPTIDESSTTRTTTARTTKRTTTARTTTKRTTTARTTTKRTTAVPTPTTGCDFHDICCLYVGHNCDYWQ